MTGPSCSAVSYHSCRRPSAALLNFWSFARARLSCASSILVLTSFEFLSDSVNIQSSNPAEECKLYRESCKPTEVDSNIDTMIADDFRSEYHQEDGAGWYPK